MPKIAISYRRADSTAIAGRIFDHLVGHYGADSVFMDIDDIPFGIDFRTDIHDTLQRSDVLVALIGANWLGANPAGGARIQEKTDPVRVEITTALERKMRLIPVLIDGAKMPSDTDLPPELANFAFLNAAELSSGRDFHIHMDRLIDAVDRAVADDTHAAAIQPRSDRAPGVAADAVVPMPNRWLIDAVRYFAVPFILLLIAHHVIVNAFDLNTVFLQTACAVVPFAFGFAILWLSGRSAGPALGLAIALGVAGATGMTVSQGLNSGDPIVPQTRFEWWDNMDFATIIALSFMVGHASARALRALLAKSGKR